MERKFSHRSCRDSNPRPFDHESGALTTELSPPPMHVMDNTRQKQQQQQNTHTHKTDNYMADGTMDNYILYSLVKALHHNYILYSLVKALHHNYILYSLVKALHHNYILYNLVKALHHG